MFTAQIRVWGLSILPLKQFSRLFDKEKRRSMALATGRVVADKARCVQCGTCSYNCPLGLDVRAYAWRGEPVNESRCITCGECVARCPRGALSFEQMSLTRFELAQ